MGNISEIFGEFGYFYLWVWQNKENRSMFGRWFYHFKPPLVSILTNKTIILLMLDCMWHCNWLVYGEGVKDNHRGCLLWELQLLQNNCSFKELIHFSNRSATRLPSKTDGNFAYLRISQSYKKHCDYRWGYHHCCFRGSSTFHNVRNGNRRGNDGQMDWQAIISKVIPNYCWGWVWSHRLCTSVTQI